jgi:hypothetical protein
MIPLCSVDPIAHPEVSKVGATFAIERQVEGQQHQAGRFEGLSNYPPLK